MPETNAIQEVEEMKLDDGMTPPPEEVPEAISQPGTYPEAGLTFEISDPDIYTEDEFYEAFKSCFAFAGDVSHLKSFAIRDEGIEGRGARCTSNRLYQLAGRYKFLHFMIDRRSGWLADATLIGLFVSMKANAIVEEAAHLSLKDILKGKLKSWFKIKQTTVKRGGSGFLGRLGLGKPPKPESLSEGLAE